MVFIEAWNEIVTSTNKDVDFKVNDQTICKLTVIRNKTELENTGCLVSIETPNGIEQRISLPEQNSCRLLILDPSLHRIVLVSAESFSCALGPAIKETVMELAEVLPAKYLISLFNSKLS